MGFFSRLRSVITGRKPGKSAHRHIHAGYDAAQTTDENRRHWANADALSANAANDKGTREKLAQRARYEVANNSYLNGLTKTVSHDLIGSGPRLQLGLSNFEAARRIEKSFAAWLRASGMMDKFRVMHETRLRDGESFGILATNPATRHPVKLDVRLIEAEQVSSPVLMPLANDEVDGIQYDQYGNPRKYTILESHPGAVYAWSSKYKTVDAQFVLHWFRPDRPGQGRGVTEYQPVLETSAILRRFTRATLLAAEFAANVSGVLKTDQAPGETVVDATSWERIEWERNAALTLPAGWSIEQLKSENPNSTYADFKRECLNESGRCINAPLNVVSGNSSGYNYSSGRLDHQIYHRSLWIERERFRIAVLDRLFLTWLDEAAMVPGLIPEGMPPFGEWEFDWHWDGFASIDPLKDANATTARLVAGLTTLAEEAAAEGKDWREVLNQLAAEKQYAESLGLKLGEDQQQDAAEEEEEEMQEAANAA